MMAGAIGLFALALTAGAAPADKPVDHEPLTVARVFLEAFARDPQATRTLTTPDALIVAHDVGGSYQDYLKGIGNTSPFPATCSLQELEQTPAPSAKELRTYPARSLGQAGRFAAVQGTYLCKGTGGAATQVAVSLILKDDLVALFSLVPRR
jgi:hypothetical protein